jgi:hypothetical protein
MPVRCNACLAVNANNINSFKKHLDKLWSHKDYLYNITTPLATAWNILVFCCSDLNIRASRLSFSRPNWLLIDWLIDTVDLVAYFIIQNRQRQQQRSFNQKPTKHWCVGLLDNATHEFACACQYFTGWTFVMILLRWKPLSIALDLDLLGTKAHTFWWSTILGGANHLVLFKNLEWENLTPFSWNIKLSTVIS